MKSACAQHGQGAIEFITVFVLFASVLLGLFEMTRVFRTKYILHHATFAAARAGSVHNARAAPMGAELANGMAPLYMLSLRSMDGLAQAIARARAMEAMPGVGVQIVSPTHQAHLDLAAQQWIRRTDAGEYAWQKVIPNDNLRWRPRSQSSLDTDSGEQTLNLQDANLLKVRTLWCHRLVVPALDHLIFEIVNAVSSTERQAICTALSVGAAASGVASGYYLAVSADAVVRMQSPVVDDDLP